MWFAAHAQHDVEQQRLRALGSMLGIFWTREAAERLLAPPQPGEMQRPLTELMLPLAVLMNPQVQEILKKTFGSRYGIDAPEWYRADPGNVVEGYRQSREDFIRVASLFTGLIPKSAH